MIAAIARFSRQTLHFLPGLTATLKEQSLANVVRPEVATDSKLLVLE